MCGLEADKKTMIQRHFMQVMKSIYSSSSSSSHHGRFSSSSSSSSLSLSLVVVAAGAVLEATKLSVVVGPAAGVAVAGITVAGIPDEGTGGTAIEFATQRTYKHRREHIAILGRRNEDGRTSPM